MGGASGITIENILEVFFRMEVDEDLFHARTDDGIFFWDIVRRDVYLALHTLHGGPFELPAPLPGRSWKSRVKDLGKPVANLVARRYLRARAPQYIFITAQRLRQGTALVDIITDPLYDLLADEAVAVELLNRSAVDYGRLFSACRTTRVPHVALRSTRNATEAAALAGRLDEAIQRHFGLRPGFARLVGDVLSAHRATLAHYRRALQSFRPRAIVGVNNGTLTGLFSAAKERGIPVVELQHGASTRHSIFWSYPASITADHPGLSQPSAYFTYSDYWMRNTHFPVRLMRAIGNDSLFIDAVASDGNDVVMISSYMYREALADLALRLAAMDPGQRIYFKLHPHEFARRAEIGAAFAQHANIHVVCDELAFPELFRRCGYVVGIQSTVIYVALQAGCRVCLLKRSNYFWHDDVFEHVELFDDAEELHRITHRPRAEQPLQRKPLPEFSSRLDTVAFLNALDEVQALAVVAPHADGSAA